MKQKKKDLKAQISDIQKEIHIYVQSNRSSTSDASQLNEKLQEKIRLLRNTREIESKLLNIAELRKQSNPSQYIITNSREQLQKLNEENKNIIKQLTIVKNEIDQKEKENSNLLIFRNTCIIEEMAVRSYNIDTVSDKLGKPNYENLFKDEENALDLADFIFNNPSCDIYTFCSIIHSLFDADDTTKIFIQKYNENQSKLEKILPRLLRFYPSIFADRSSFLYRCGFEVREDIIQKAQNEIKTSLSGSITKFSSKNGNIQQLSSIFNDKITYKSFVQPKNIFTSSLYTDDEITDVFILFSNLVFGLFKPEFMIRDNFEIIKPQFMKDIIDIERISMFIISDLQKMIDESSGKDDKNIILLLTRIKNIRENLKKKKNFFAASFLTLAKVIENTFKDSRISNYNEKYGRLIHDSEMDIIVEKEELMNDLKNGSTPNISNTQIDANQRLFYLVPYQNQSLLDKKRKGLLIPFRDYYETALQYIGLTMPYQRPIGPKSIDINLFREFAVMAQYGK